MSDLLLFIAVKGAAPGKAIGIKEAIAMDVEKYGDVQVLRVDILEPEQMALDGVVPEQRTAPAPVPPGGRAQPASSEPEPCGPRRPRQVSMACCLNCECYRQEAGVDEGGKFRWGVCRLTGRAVRNLKDQCGSWAQEGLR